MLVFSRDGSYRFTFSIFPLGALPEIEMIGSDNFRLRKYIAYHCTIYSKVGFPDAALINRSQYTVVRWDTPTFIIALFLIMSILVL